MNGEVEDGQRQKRDADHSISFEATERRVEFTNRSVWLPNGAMAHARSALQLKISGTVKEDDTSVPASLYLDVKDDKRGLGRATYEKTKKGVYHLYMEVTEEEFDRLLVLRADAKLTVEARTWEPDSQDSKVGRVQTISLISNV